MKNNGPHRYLQNNKGFFRHKCKYSRSLSCLSINRKWCMKCKIETPSNLVSFIKLSETLKGLKRKGPKECKINKEKYIYD